MRSFIDLDRTLADAPARLGVVLSRIDVGRGREELYQDQLPELLAHLADQTRIASIRASTAIEGYDVPQERAERLADVAPARIRNRNEREFAGYRDAIDGLIRAGVDEPVSIPLILRLHRALYAHSGGRGGHLKSEDNEIVEYDADGRRRLVFRPASAGETPFLLGELIVRYRAARADDAAHPLLLVALLVLDFLAIHPVADGNGRLSRLIATSELLRAGYGVARHVSVEQRIYESKAGYYAALRESQRGWHEGAHSPWPWATYFAGVLAQAYDDFENRVAAARSTRGMSKQQIVRHHLGLIPAGREFRMRDLRRALPGISDQTFRIVLGELRDLGWIRVDGRGNGASWTRLNVGGAGTGDTPSSPR